MLAGEQQNRRPIPRNIRSDVVGIYRCFLRRDASGGTIARDQTKANADTAMNEPCGECFIVTSGRACDA